MLSMDTTKDVALDINTKADLVAAAKVAVDANITYDRSINGAVVGLGLTPITDAVDLVNLEVTDNYGVEYKTLADITKYKAFLGVQYVVSDIQATTGATTAEKAVTVDARWNILHRY